MHRREFLASLAAASLATLPACGSPPKPPLPPGDLLGPSLEFGHRLREPDFPPPSETRRIPVVIVGAGGAGSTAAGNVAEMGKHVALIERDKLGGTCLNYGCDPTKTLLHKPSCWIP